MPKTRPPGGAARPNSFSSGSPRPFGLDPTGRPTYGPSTYGSNPRQNFGINTPFKNPPAPSPKPGTLRPAPPGGWTYGPTAPVKPGIKPIAPGTIKPAPPGTAPTRIPGAGVGLGLGISILQELLFPPPAAAPTLEDMGIAPHGSTEPTGGELPFEGGQGNVDYYVTCKGKNERSYDVGPIPPGGTFYDPGPPFSLSGPITGLAKHRHNGKDYWAIMFNGGANASLVFVQSTNPNTAEFNYGAVGYKGGATAGVTLESSSVSIVSITRADGQPDTDGDPPIIPGTETPPTPQPNRPPSNALPGGRDNPEPVTPPAPANPGPQVTPGLNRPPALQPDTPLSPPSPLGEPDPTPPPAPNTPTEPRSPDTGTGGGEPAPPPTDLGTFIGDKVKLQRPGLPPGLQGDPIAGGSVGLAPGTPTTETEPEKQSVSFPPFFFRPSDDPDIDLDGPSNQFPPIIPPPVEPPKPPRDQCQTGCTARLLSGQNSLLDAINLAGTGANMGALNEINSKLGPQIGNGGIGGAFTRLYDTLKIDRALNLLNLALLLHNAHMLSANIFETFGVAVDSVLRLTGFQFQDAEGNEVPLTEVISGTVQDWLVSILGAEAYQTLTLAQRKVNRIYQAGTNIMYSVRGMLDAARDTIELTAENTGKIGNALRKAGVVFENAYGVMDQQIVPGDKFQRAFDRFRDTGEQVENSLQAIEQISSNVLETGTEFTELQQTRDQAQQEMADLRAITEGTIDQEKLDAEVQTDISPIAFKRAPNPNP